MVGSLFAGVGHLLISFPGCRKADAAAPETLAKQSSPFERGLQVLRDEDVVQAVAQTAGVVGAGLASVVKSIERIAIDQRAVVVEKRGEVESLAALGRRPFVQIPQYDHMLSPLNEPVVDFPHLAGLTLTIVAATAGLRLEVIRRNVNLAVGRRPDLVLGTIAAEDRAPIVRRIHVGSDGLDTEPGAGHDGHVDTAIVVAIDEHDVTIAVLEKLFVETYERRTAPLPLTK